MIFANKKVNNFKKDFCLIFSRIVWFLAIFVRTNKNSYVFSSICLSIVFCAVLVNNWIDSQALIINWVGLVHSCILFSFYYVLNVKLVELLLIPEFFLAFSAAILMTHYSLIAFNKKYNSVSLQFSTTSLCMLIVFLSLLLYLREGFFGIKHFSFNFFLLIFPIGFLYNIIKILVSLFCMYLLQDYTKEYNLFVLFMVLGLMMLLITDDFGTIFLVLELQSISLYMLSRFKRSSIYSIENGLKYFILGAFSTACFLLGWGLLYSISGLFVLLGFFFFFSDFNKIVKKIVAPYETTNENQSDNFELIENTLTPWNNFCFEVSYEFDEIGILLLFNNHFKVMLKLVEFLCFDGNNDNIKYFFGYFKLWCRRKIELFLLLKNHTELIKESLTKIIPFLCELKEINPVIVNDEIIRDCVILIDFVSEHVFGFKLYTDIDTQAMIGIPKYYSNIIHFKSSRINIVYWKRESLLKNIASKSAKVLESLNFMLFYISFLPPTPENILLKEKLEVSLFILSYLFQFVIGFFDLESQRFFFMFYFHCLFKHYSFSERQFEVISDGLRSEIFFKNLKVLTKTL